MATGGQLQGDTYGAGGSWDSTNIPVNGDRAMIPATNSNALITDAGGASDDVNLALLFSHPGFQGKFGSIGTHIIGSAALLHIMGTGQFNYTCKTANVDRALIECATAGGKVQLSSASGGTFDWLDLLRGEVVCDGNILFGASAIMRVAQKTSASDVNVTIDESGGTLPRLEQGSGVSQINNLVTEINLAGGTCTKDLKKAPTINVYGGEFIYNHASVGGEVLRVVVWPGATFNMMANSNVKVIDQLVEMPNSIVLWDKSMHTITDHIVMKASRAA